MINIFILFWVIALARGSGRSHTETFVRNIIEEWQLQSPTIMYRSEIPEICLKVEWVLCLEENTGSDELVEHLAMIHRHRKQDGLIFADVLDTKEVITQLGRHLPTLFSSECPVFMPAEYAEDINLRLDSNIIFFSEATPNTYELIDNFAVKGGAMITLTLGYWNFEEGIILQESKNRWDRRMDLKGANFTNCLMENGNWAEFIKDSNGNIIGSEGYFQDMLFFFTDWLNLNIDTVEGSWAGVDLLENGSWTGIMGRIQRKEVDVISSGMGINLQYKSIVDLPIATDRQPMTLIAARPKGTGLTAWSYIQVYGLHEWMVFAITTISLGMALALLSALFLQNDDKQISFGTRRGAKKDYQLQTALSSFALVFLYVIQMGSHTDSKMKSAKLLTLTTSMLTLLMFIYYANDITAEMTAGPAPIQIRTFEDVINGNYKVFTTSDYAMRILKNAKPGSAKNRVYKSNFELIRTDDYKTTQILVLNELISDPKNLLYNNPSAILVNEVRDDVQRLKKQVFALKMDDAVYGSGTLALQANSEFLPMFNYYILKEIESGYLKRIYREYHMGYFINEEFEMNEPQPLGFTQVMFCFSMVAFGICLSLVIITMEWLVSILTRKISRKRV